ncbi:MAG: 1-(5-phosphoribosyl)-5-[(5-phosphoribosylamino)methylideneamino]imidazole-4-carboxamide isomerase [Bacteroidales bacterium]|nr:1-(5-phosphoribosyl)-5-[(5-phosphoribosylamino)methylideneamino]imidazole-4-carboxamide isomerase [Bacteroidales bacterium]MBN2633425.1 1-(5-phosphoribosyl)-5-[(5-phosphoribosylamino)methylideneamino]imidazole-4-carboxamide isomerase [Bacteroidales bacterium]
MRIIAAIDILGGKCVRLTRGDFSTSKVYNEDPVEVAKELENNGIRYLHMVDLDGAGRKKIVNADILRKTASSTSLLIDFGGGIRSEDDVRTAFDAGARQITAGSIAVHSPETAMRWLEKYGSDRIILGADATGRMIMTDGWQSRSEEDVISFIKGYRMRGFRYVICTDVSKDGMLQGPATELYREIINEVDINLIASGGVSSLRDIENVKDAGCEGVIIGKALYEGKIKLKELKDIC